MNIPNTQRRILNVWFVITLVFLAGVFLPSFAGMDGMEGGYGISFLSGCMVLTGVIVILVYRIRAKQMDAIIKGEGRLAEWRLTADEWMKFIEADYRDEKRTRRNLFIMVTVIALIIGVILTLLLEDGRLLLITAFILAVIAIPAFLSPWLRKKKLNRSGAQVLISENGLIVGNLFYLWKKLGARLDGVTIDEEAQPPVLTFTYSMPTRMGMQQETVRVPVPSGKLPEALKVVAHFKERVA